eukprot:jgi/Mesvir1/21257/Mv21661-RA.1
MRVIMVQRLLRTYGEAHGVMPQELMFHMDGFAKISRTGLMGFTMGLSDLQGRFHPLALALTSRHQGPDVEKMVIALAAEVKRVCNVPFAPKWVMGDADDAQRNGIQQAFANVITKDDVGAVRAEMPEFLMCYYHVVACTDKKLLELGGSFKAKKAGDAASIEIARAKTMVHARIAEIHFADSKGQVDEAVAAALEEWESEPRLKGIRFAAYFNKEWLSSRFCNWQVMCTSRPGMSVTNNPCEHEHAHIKGAAGTDHKKHYAQKLAEILGTYLTHRSKDALPFSTECVPSKNSTLKARAKEMLESRTLTATRGPAGSTTMFVQHHLVPDADGLASLTAELGMRPGWDFDVGITKETVGGGTQKSTNGLGAWALARMERKLCPPEGWAVDMVTGKCPCMPWRKFGFCLHHFATFLKLKKALPGERAPPLCFHNPTRRGRGGGRRGRVQHGGKGRGGQAQGRPPKVGAALAME